MDIRKTLSAPAPRPGEAVTAGDAAASKAAVRDWIDGLSLDAAAKSAAGKRAVVAYERCRAGGDPPKVVPAS